MDIFTKRDEIIQKTGLTLPILHQKEFHVLSKSEIASLLKVAPRQLTETIILTPGKPRIGKSYLTFFSPLLIETQESGPNNYALYSSQFQDIGYVGVQVSFPPISVNKAHLVEFNVTLHATNQVYKFRQFEYPMAVYQDISLSNQKVISVVVDAINLNPVTLGAELQQRNTVAEKASWMLHSVRITATT